MSYPFYVHGASSSTGKVAPGRNKYVSAASDAGTDTTTSSGVLFNDAAGVILTPTGSTSGSAYDIIDAHSTGSLTPTGSLSPSLAPSVTSENAAAPFIDLEDLLKNEFDSLTIQEKSRALASVRKIQYSSYGASCKAETDILTKADAAEIGEDGGAGGDGQPSLADWQALCMAVGVTEDEVPSSITQCKKTLKSYNVNLSDLSDALDNGTVAQTFPSVAALARYSKHEGKVASKAAMKKDPMLKMMLRELFRGCKGKK